MAPRRTLELGATDQRLGTLALFSTRPVGHDLVLERHGERPARSPGRRAAGEPLHRARRRRIHVDVGAGATGDQRAVRRLDPADAAVIGSALRERGEREAALATGHVVENELAARAESSEQGSGVAPSCVVLGGRGRRRGLVVMADAVHDRRGGHDGRRQRPDHTELGYPATSAAAEASFSPKRARGTNWPIPGFPTTSPPSTITFPRRSTVSTSPTTSVPS